MWKRHKAKQKKIPDNNDERDRNDIFQIKKLKGPNSCNHHLGMHQTKCNKEKGVINV